MKFVSSMALLLAASATVAPARAQERFETPEAAVEALLNAVDAHDAARLAAMFGPQGNAILSSGSLAQDRAEQTEFSQLARAKHQLEADRRNAARMILAIGDEDWPFPVPLVRREGKWSFDPSQSAVEMEARRIGTHELDAIEICAGFVESQRRYASEDRDKDGLLKYALHVSNAASELQLPPEFLQALWDGQKRASRPYHGYYFRVLDRQGPHALGGAHSYRVKDKLLGGFGLVAWPAQYGVTGIHTFLVNQDGVVYEKDIAPAPGGAMAPIAEFDPDPSWRPVE
jgi:hypothetical protein